MPQVRVLTPDGAEIRARRLSLGLTPEQLAQRLPGYTHPQTIRRLERGAIERAGELLIHQLAQALEADVEDITRRAAA